MPSLTTLRRGFKRGGSRLVPTLLSFLTSQLSALTVHIEVPRRHKFLATELQTTQTMSHAVLMRGGWVQEVSRCKLLQPNFSLVGGMYKLINLAADSQPMNSDWLYEGGGPAAGSRQLLPHCQAGG